MITLEVPVPVRTPDKNGLNLTFASNFPKGTLSKRPNHPRPSTYNPCTPRHLAFWSWTPTRLQSHGCLLASLLLPTSLCYPGMSDAKTQHQLPTPYPETSFGIAVRHSGEPMVARIRVLPVPSSTPFLTGRLPTLAWKGRPGLASFYPLSHPGTAVWAWRPTCGCPGTAAAVSFHQTTNLWPQKPQR